MPRGSAAREIPPPLELECLKVLWVTGEASVRDVQQTLAPSRALAYTTVMTVLERLVRKGAVARRKDGRAFLYAASVSRETLRVAAVRQLLESFFDGSREELVAYLGGAPATEAPVQPAQSRAAASAGPELDTALL